MAGIVGPGVRRCLANTTRNGSLSSSTGNLGPKGNSALVMMKAELSQLVQERKAEPIPKNTKFLVPFFYRSSFTDDVTEGSNPTSTGNLTSEEVDRLISLLTLKVRASDEAVLESYTQFMKRAANVLDLDVCGKVIIPMHGGDRRSLLKSPQKQPWHACAYNQPFTHARMLQVRASPGDAAGIYLEYIQRNIPEGVSMSVEQTEMERIPDYCAEYFFK